MTYICLLALALPLAFYAIEYNLGLNLADEGYAWYPAIRTLRGDVPIREFASYDPGRFYWLAGWMTIFGESLAGFRAACATFLVPALMCGLLAASRVTQHRAALAAVALLLLAWMFPGYKVFDSAQVLFAVYGGVLLLESPTWRRHFLAGAVVGLVTFFGRNWGLYSCVGMLGLMALCNFRAPWRITLRNILAFGAGGIAGFLPMIVLIFAVPGFFDAYIESIFEIVRRGGSSPARPLAWPIPGKLGPIESFSDLSQMFLHLQERFTYVLLPGALGVGALMIAFRPQRLATRSPLLVAATAIGLPCTYAYMVRTDLYHFSQATGPALLVLIALTAAAWRPPARGMVRTLGTALLGGVLALGISERPIGRYMLEPHTRLVIDGGTYKVPQWVGHRVETIRRYMPARPKRSAYALLVPMLTSLYPILDYESAIYEIYPMWPASDSMSDAALAAMRQKRPYYVLAWDEPADGNAARLFQNTYPEVWRYILDHYERVPTPDLHGHILMRLRDGR